MGAGLPDQAEDVPPESIFSLVSINSILPGSWSWYKPAVRILVPIRTLTWMSSTLRPTD